MSNKDKDLVAKAHRIFNACVDRERENNRLYQEDLKFAHGDSDNGWQWDENLAKSRAIDNLPCLTINKIRQHNLQITNDAKKNRAMPKVVPVDEGADQETAEVFNSVIRHIKANSGADISVAMAFEFAVDGGIGYWRVVTDYIDDTSNNQDIFIQQVENPMLVYLYGNKKPDGSDADGGFIFEDIEKDVAESKYPGINTRDTWDNIDGGWRDSEKIRVCEWFYKETVNDLLVETEDGEQVLLSTIKDKDPGIDGNAHTVIRKVKRQQIKWVLIAGDEILERKDWLGKYIPIVRVVGEEKVIDGKVCRWSHTRGMKDAQRMYNFWTSSAAAFVSAQGKTPWDGPAESFAGYESFWDSANTDTHAYLPWNHKDNEGEPLPRPQRSQPPVMAQAYIDGMRIASDEIQAASGQYDAQLGENANQQSGRALQSLQRKGDNATYHFLDSVDNANRYTAMILIDLIPKIYDTARIVRMIGEDDSEELVEVDPAQDKAKIEKVDHLTGKVKKIFNLGIGKYDVIAASGSSYATKRAEALDGMGMMLQANPALWQTHGDIIAKAQDWPFAEEFAERSKKTLPPGLLDDNKEGQQEIPPQVQQQLQQYEQQLQQLDMVIQKMTEEMESKEGEKEKLALDRYKAETDRLKAVMPILSPAQAQAVALQALDDLNTPDTLAEEAEMRANLQPDVYGG